MNRQGCIHPEILSVLSRCGHGDRILIADGNYPIASRCPQAAHIYLGVSAGIPGVPEVLDAILAEINVEEATVMTPGSGTEPQIFAEFKKRLPGINLREFGRFEFYAAATEPNVRLAISTGESRTYANILLTIGVAGVLGPEGNGNE